MMRPPDARKARHRVRGLVYVVRNLVRGATAIANASVTALTQPYLGRGRLARKIEHGKWIGSESNSQKCKGVKKLIAVTDERGWGA